MCSVPRSNCEHQCQTTNSTRFRTSTKTTQGLSDYVSGTLDPDATALVTDAADVPLESGLVAEVLLDIEIDAVAATDGVLGSVSEYVRR